MSLQVVDKPVSESPVPKKYEAIHLSTQEAYDKYWAQCVPHLQRCIETMHGEATVEDLYAACLKGEMFSIVAKNDDTEVPDVKLIIILQVLSYPRYNTMNVVALGGKDLKNSMKEHWSDVQGWARICGARQIECSVAPAMERILSAAGFERKYVQLKQNLMEV